MAEIIVDSRNSFVIGEELQIGICDGEITCPGVVWARNQDSLDIALNGGVSAQTLALKDGMVVQVIKQTAEGMFVMESELLRRTGSTRPHLIIRRNDQWYRVQRRGDVRIDVLLDVTDAVLIVGARRIPVSGSVVNISAGGLLFRTHDNMPLANTLVLELKVHLPDRLPPLTVRINVTRLVSGRRSGMLYHDLGGKYVEMPDRDNQRVARFVFQEQLRLRKKAQGL